LREFPKDVRRVLGQRSMTPTRERAPIRQGAEGFGVRVGIEIVDTSMAIRTVAILHRTFAGGVYFLHACAEEIEEMHCYSQLEST